MRSALTFPCRAPRIAATVKRCIPNEVRPAALPVGIAVKTEERAASARSLQPALFWAVLGLGVLVRIVYYLQVKDSFLFRTPVLDAKYYHAWAMEILGGDLLGRARGVFTMSPGYPYVLALVYRLFGAQAHAIVLLQLASGVLSGVLVHAIARRHFSQPAALVAMALYLLYAPGIFFEGVVLKAALINLLNLAALWFVLTCGPLGLALSGALLGLSAQLRPNVLLVVPIVVLWVVRRGKRVPRALVAFGSGLVLALLPVAVRNYAVGKEFVLTTAHGGMNFYTGNSPYSLGPYTPLPFARTNPEHEQQDFLAQARKMSGSNLTPGESSSFWVGQTLGHIASHPVAWLRLLGRKILIFANDYEPQINLNYYFFMRENDSVLASDPVSYGVVFPLAMIGIVSGGASLLLGGYVLVYFLTAVLFFVASEYRFAVVPVLCVYAGAGAAGLVRRFRDGTRKEAAAWAGLLLICAALSNLDVYATVFGYPNYQRSQMANSYFGMGERYEEHGDVESAKRAYRKAIAILPLAAPLINLARISSQERDFVQALELSEAALKADPGSAEASYNIGVLLFMKRDYGRAAGYFEAALARKPDFVEARNNLDLVRTAAGGR